MKEIIVQYAAYNAWATERLMKVATGMSDEVLNTEVKSSFKSIYATFLHMWDAEYAWFQRVKLAEQIQVPSLSFRPTMNEVAEGLMKQNREWRDYLTGLPEHAFNHIIAYRNTKKEEFKEPLWHIVMHVVNHGTFHRGQIVTMMRNLGVNELPATDMIVFLRAKS